MTPDLSKRVGIATDHGGFALKESWRPSQKLQATK